jgi:hypothetical protein
LAGAPRGEPVKGSEECPRLFVAHGGASRSGLMFFPIILPPGPKTAATIVV